MQISAKRVHAFDHVFDQPEVQIQNSQVKEIQVKNKIIKLGISESFMKKSELPLDCFTF